ncbi:MAG: hypothetical protein ACRDRI_01365 [Pseudonocardiaceae bacterium]
MLIDIFDDRYQHIGVRDKTTARPGTLWHRTFSCLVVNPTQLTRTQRWRQHIAGSAGHHR